VIFGRFRAMTLSLLHLVVNWPIFTIYINDIRELTQNQSKQQYTQLVTE